MWDGTPTLGRRVATVGKHGKMPFKALGNIVADAAPPDPVRPCGQDDSKAVSRGTSLSSLTVPAIFKKHDGRLVYSLVSEAQI